jgi:hypothetical protein
MIFGASRARPIGSPKSPTKPIAQEKADVPDGFMPGGFQSTRWGRALQKDVPGWIGSPHIDSSFVSIYNERCS